MGYLSLYRARSSLRQVSIKPRLRKYTETSLKTVLLLVYPIPATITMLAFWYFVFYTRHIHFGDEVKEIAIAAWIPIFGLLYALISAVVIKTVFSEYKSIRTAVKLCDIETFMVLRDEDMSPVVHAAMTVLALAVLGGFMALSYPTMLSGSWFIGSTTYLFALMFWVVREIDNPCSGIWFIKNIHDEWLMIDPIEWRAPKFEASKPNWEKFLPKAPCESKP